MNSLRIIFGLFCMMALFACNEKPGGLKSFDACSCASVQDQNSDDYRKCQDLRKDARFEADYQKCRLAAASGISDTSRITIQNAATAANLQSAGSGSYVIDPSGSLIRWYAQKATGKKHHGSMAVKSGEFSIQNNQITGKVIIHMSSIQNTDLEGEAKAKLEKHLKSEDFFATDKFPEASFEIVSSVQTNPIEYDVTGKLTIKGITNEMKCHLVVAPNGQDANVGGGFKFDRSKFDVRYGSDTFFDNLGNDLIENDVMITLDIKARKNA